MNVTQVILRELINYYLMGDTPAKAEEFLDAAIKQEPNKAEYYRAKGSLYEKLNQPEKAEAMYIKTLELNPNDFFAQYNLGNIHLIPYFEKALELNPNDKNTLTTLKELYFRLRTKNKVYQEKYDKTMEALNSL